VCDQSGTVVSGINVLANSLRTSPAQMLSRFLEPLQVAAKKLSACARPRA
jgi:DNA-binding IclR family transcriptional regulator